MDSQELIGKLSPFVKKHFLSLVLGFLGLMFLGYGLIVLLGSSDSSNDVVFEAKENGVLSSEPSSGATSQVRQLVVDVEGAVLKPGIYSLASDSRLSDALIAAGGLSESADRDWLAKNINLAIKLADGTKIYIPRVGEDTKAITPLRSASPNFAGQAGITSNTQININTASEQALDALPGVGPVTVQKIINGRPYSSIDELLSKKIVGSKVFEEIREKITVY